MDPPSTHFTLTPRLARGIKINLVTTTSHDLTTSTLLGPACSLGYDQKMELRTGRVIKGAIILDEDDDLEEGAAVAVWIGDPNKPVRTTDEELEMVRKGQAQAARGELIDARAFLRELRRRS